MNQAPKLTPKTQNQTTEPAKKNTAAVIGMMVVFLAPVFIAYICLNTGIYQSFGTSNRGILLDPPMKITEHSWINQQQAKITSEMLHDNWWLVYHMPKNCSTTCEQRLLQLRQSVQTLGPEAYRVQPLIIIHSDSDVTTLKTWQDQLTHMKKEYLIAQFSPIKNTISPYHSELLFKGVNTQLEDGGLYIVDPMGFAMLYYSPVTSSEDAISQAKSLIKDLKYLLKVSRIG